MDAIITNVENDELIDATRREVNKFMERFPLYETEKSTVV
jgi:hypothetical protein